MRIAENNFKLSPMLVENYQLNIALGVGLKYNQLTILINVKCIYILIPVPLNNKRLNNMIITFDYAVKNWI